MAASWIKRPWGWVRKGAAAIAGFLGYGGGGYGDTPYGS
jgi:hypothetical protein